MLKQQTAIFSLNISCFIIHYLALLCLSFISDDYEKKEVTEKKAKYITAEVHRVILFGTGVAWLLSLKNLLWERKHNHCSIEFR